MTSFFQDGHVLTDGELHHLADQLVTLSGVVGVMLGGSRARGDDHPDSDIDLGLYYQPPLDTEVLRRLARSVATARSDQGPEPDVTEPGGWGPWVDGGGWMMINNMPVDWIYRDIDRVRRSADLAVRGEFDFHFQVGHPFGMPDFAYAGEVALGVVLADPTGELGRVKHQLEPYPQILGQAVVERLDEARFLLGALTKPAHRSDTTYVAGCLFRVVTLCAHAVHAKAGHWVINEKGIVDAADRLTSAPVKFGIRAHGILAQLGTRPEQLLTAIDEARALVTDVSAG
jgi:predicted nucleotidyltransferase